jgi:hypothetical protein
MPLGLAQCKGAIFPVGVVLALSIFVGTFYMYFFCHQAHVQCAHLTVTIGSTVFLSVMAVLNYLAQVNGTRVKRFIKAAGIGGAQTILFLVLLWFLIVNTSGA